MEISQPDFGGRRPIDAYGDGGFRIGGSFHSGGLLIVPEKLATLGNVAVEGLTEDLLRPILEQADQFDFVLLGCGDQIKPVPKHVRDLFQGKNVPIDFMDTGAACRTFNVLLAEGRSFAAVLIAVE